MKSTNDRLVMLSDKFFIMNAQIYEVKASKSPFIMQLKSALS